MLSTAMSQFCASLLLVTTITTLFLHTSQACSPVPGWEAQPLTSRAKEALHIVYGSVSKVFNRSPGSQEYVVELNIHCVLKGGSSVGIVNVTEIQIDCVDSNMQIGESYVVFVHILRDGQGRNRYVTNDVNVQAAAQKATKENLQSINESFVDTVYRFPTCDKAVHIPVAGGNPPVVAGENSPVIAEANRCVNATDADCSGDSISWKSNYVLVFIAVLYTLHAVGIQ